MIKQIAIMLGIFFSITSTFAFEDCIVTSDGKLTDIKIQDDTIVSIYPVITILNEKNTFIIQPLKEGQTKVCVLKDNKQLINFEIKITKDETFIEETDGIEILTFDVPEIPFELDAPPMLKEGENTDG